MTDPSSTPDPVVAELIEQLSEAIDVNSMLGGEVDEALLRDCRAQLTALSERVAEKNAEIERLRDTLDVERYKVAIGVQAIARAVQGRKWLSQPGRGSYAYDDERYQQEFGAALDEIEGALSQLQSIAQDWSDCPRDPLRVAANRDKARSTLPPPPATNRETPNARS